ncbi:keratin-associated protein 5-3-like [Eriocheir sinensis]|uniref:keratin-associated protein 5-3-like n=1 Tax=Eriocheir sinensis TaxID=95602 RepID=UPI0021CAD3C6|nr:keratin-associated protein 5-3-like [Eriocheir sinensis]
MRTALIVGLLTLLALDVCQSKADGEKQGDGSRTVDADTEKLFEQRDQPLRSYSSNKRAELYACPTDMCGTSGMGTCKTDCMDGEFTAGNCESSPSKCCEPCDAAGSCDDGRCVSDARLCTPDEYSDGDCGFGSCSCCKTCQASDDCAEAGGQCIKADATCGAGLSPNPRLGCSDDKNCQCCAPADRPELRVCESTNACAGGLNPGRCVFETYYCNDINEYLTDDACGSCTCCRTCEPDYLCAHKNGICVNPTRGAIRTISLHDQCPTGYYHNWLGTCNTGDCICCVPKHHLG